ncbi:MAG: hypothetical protein IJ728_11575 [Selenomonadaceae bacterium]|nr:hypothetical protein [Selenomonadaceae bacterium]
MYEFFKIIFYIEFFVLPISAGFLTRALIKGKKIKPYLIAVASSSIMLVVSFIGIYLNAPPDIRASIRNKFEQLFYIEEVQTNNNDN